MDQLLSHSTIWYNYFMKIPVFEVIELEEVTQESVKKLIASGRIGKAPLNIVLNTLDLEMARKAVEQLLDYLISEKISAKFPYPIYIISEVLEEHPEIEIMKTIEDVPSHFKRRVKRLTNKEQLFLNKSNSISEKLIKSQIGDINSELFKYFSKQRELFDLTKELHFYNQIFDELTNNDDVEDYG